MPVDSEKRLMVISSDEEPLAKTVLDRVLIKTPRKNPITARLPRPRTISSGEDELSSPTKAYKGKTLAAKAKKAELSTSEDELPAPPKGHKVKTPARKAKKAAELSSSEGELPAPTKGRKGKAPATKAKKTRVTKRTPKDVVPAARRATPESEDPSQSEKQAGPSDRSKGPPGPTSEALKRVTALIADLLPMTTKLATMLKKASVRVPVSVS